MNEIHPKVVQKKVSCEDCRVTQSTTYLFLLFFVARLFRHHFSITCRDNIRKKYGILISNILIFIFTQNYQKIDIIKKIEIDDFNPNFHDKKIVRRNNKLE